MSSKSTGQTTKSSSLSNGRLPSGRHYARPIDNVPAWIPAKGAQERPSLSKEYAWEKPIEYFSFPWDQRDYGKKKKKTGAGIPNWTENDGKAKLYPKAFGGEPKPKNGFHHQFLRPKESTSRVRGYDRTTGADERPMSLPTSDQRRKATSPYLTQSSSTRNKARLDTHTILIDRHGHVKCVCGNVIGCPFLSVIAREV
eukprot:CAMPEP_0198198602 /NCGR_PEP_ID=MMETSP1445-20131203/2075_1 /TAXON_ID=36898 /ORGANISM="Pyramimonas sp., Strain CCMP2087" /LENGTH=197 /DNA_ID=CAMNT_0043868223 /DNA_START=230 /DNA_END=823 /DNA_ORIENTATION=+